MIIKSVDHIQKLTERVERKKADLDQERAFKASQEARGKTIREAAEWIVTDFWCTQCARDFTCSAFKEVQTSWVSGEPIAFYRAWKRDREHYCHSSIRYITDKHCDPYYEQSEMIRRERHIHAKDLLRPDEYGFKTLYGDPQQKLWDEMEATERANHTKTIQISK